jgi:hypothetical protein
MLAVVGHIPKVFMDQLTDKEDFLQGGYNKKKLSDTMTWKLLFDR